MDQEHGLCPKVVNEDHFSTGSFPKIIAFCERDELSLVRELNYATCFYTFENKKIYKLEVKSGKWGIIRYDDEVLVKVSTGSSLGEVLIDALQFTSADVKKQDKKVNILLPVLKEDKEMAEAVMYHLGGYATSIALTSVEQKIIQERYNSPELTCLAYSHVPIEYIDWLKDELKNKDVLGKKSGMDLWIYKK